jgi:CDP-6-deoxy-D-xylo-4-hexulose-3-dehydrase
MVTTSDSALYDDFKSIRSHGWVRGRSDEKEWASKFNEIDSRFMFIMAGYNLRPTEIQGAIGLVQMRKLDGMLDVRADLARQVNDLNNKYSPWMRLVGSEHLKKKATDRRSRTHSWMTLPFLLSKGAPIDLATVKKTFESAGVETRPIIAGNMAYHPAAKAYKIKSASSLKNADMILENGFMIGCHTTGVEEGLSVLEDAFQRISKI